jgi:hypothetical protein
MCVGCTFARICIYTRYMHICIYVCMNEYMNVNILMKAKIHKVNKIHYKVDFIIATQSR